MDEFPLSQSERKYNPIELYQVCDDGEEAKKFETIQEDNQKIYFINNLVIRIAWYDGYPSNNKADNTLISEKLIKSFGHGNFSVYPPFICCRISRHGYRWRCAPYD